MTVDVTAMDTWSTSPTLASATSRGVDMANCQRCKHLWHRHGEIMLESNCQCEAHAVKGKSSVTGDRWIANTESPFKKNADGKCPDYKLSLLAFLEIL